MAEASGTSGRLSLVLVTHATKLLEVVCDEVDLPGREGDLGILPGHTPLISTLRPGRITYRDGSSSHSLVVATGFCEIFQDTVTVLAETAELAENIDSAAAREALEAARRAADHASDDNRQELEDAVALAEARVEVAQS